MNKNKGFTMIELIIVIVILGILAAVAIPRYFDFTANARAAAMNGIAGSVASANAIVHAAALANGQTGATGSVSMDGASVATVFGYASSNTNGIEVAAQAPASGTVLLTQTATTATWTAVGAATPASCRVVYTAATSASVPATVTSVVTGC